MEYDPEAFSLEMEEFQNACNEDLARWMFWKDLGFSDDDCFRLTIRLSVNKEQLINVEK